MPGISTELSIGRDGNLTSSFHPTEKGTFGGDSQANSGVVHRASDWHRDGIVVPPYSHSQCALAWCRKNQIWGKPLTDPLIQPQSYQSRGGEDDPGPIRVG